MNRLRPMTLPGAVLFFLFAHADAAAEEPRLTLDVGTDVPLGIGAFVETEFGPRVRLGLGALWVPPGYVELSDEVAQGVGGYNDLTSELVRAATDNALALRLRAGIRPIPTEGLYIDFIYTVLTLGGAFSAADLAGASGQDSSGGEAVGWDLASTVHQLGFEVGWRFLLPERLSLRVGIGGSFTVAADVTAEAVDPARPMLADAVARAGEVYLQDTFLSYVHLPVLSVALGWDFLGPPPRPND